MKRTGGIRGIIDVVDGAPPLVTKTFEHEVADLAEAGDVSEVAVFRAPQAITLIDIGIINGATAAVSVKDSHTSVWTIKNSAGTTIVTETFDSTTTFVGANAYVSLGTLAVTSIAQDDTLTLTITNGTSANLGPLRLQGEYK